MSTWQVALIKEQGAEFAVVCVRDSVIDNPTEREELLRWWAAHLARPVALMGSQRHRSYGRRDIVGWLESVDPARLPWRQLNVAA
jgi:hypothetical protein